MPAQSFTVPLQWRPSSFCYSRERRSMYFVTTSLSPVDRADSTCLDIPGEWPEQLPVHATLGLG